MFSETWCSAEPIAPSKFNVGFFFFKASTQYQTWIYDKQIAGFYQQFGNITFLTIKVSFRHPCSLSRSFLRCRYTFLNCSFHKIHWCAAAVCERLHVLKHDSTLLFQGAGHMVPQWAPGPSFQMLQSFLSNKPYWTSSWPSPVLNQQTKLFFRSGLEWILRKLL